jgi:flagellar biosynthesis protein FlhF
MNAQVKTFRAPDPRAALDAVKAAFGDEAVILHTREISGGLWGKPEIEITAASSGEAAARSTGGTTITKVPTSGAGRPEVDNEVASLRRVVEELRSELRNQRAEPQGTDPSMTPAGLRLVRRLIQQGVDNPVADELARLCVREAASPREPDMLEALETLLRRRLQPARTPWERGERRVLAMIGPTGVGKTTTIAKIAARALLDSRLKVALVTVDTYRIGATEHLGRYGEIMGAPTHVARDAASLADAIARASDADLVLVDTAGRPDAPSIAAQSQLLHTVPDIEIHLVLSAASGAREIRAAAKRYDKVGVHRLIFSKLDEADGPGSVLSAPPVISAPLSCITDGQRVPDDVHSAAGPRLIDTIIGR